MGFTKPEFASNEPAINWFVHVLTENVGWIEWGLECIKHPIPSGSKIILKDSKEYIIECNNQEVRDMVVGLAQRYQNLEREYYAISGEVGTVWRPASEWPDNMNSSCRCRQVIVDSAPLHYIGGCHFGHHDYTTNKWYVHINGNVIEHAVEQWRHTPRPPYKESEYADVKDEVERLKKEAHLKW